QPPAPPGARRAANARRRCGRRGCRQERGRFSWAWPGVADGAGSDCVECGFLPATARVLAVAFEGDHVETAGAMRVLRVGADEACGRADQALALAPRDRGGGAAETRVATIAHFHENQRLAIAHDQVQLAEAGAVVARHQGQPRLREMRAGALFERVADAAHQGPLVVGADVAGAGVLVAGAGAEAGSPGEPDSAGRGCSVGAPSSRLPASGRATPFSKRAHVRTRWMRPKASSVRRPLAPVR